MKSKLRIFSAVAICLAALSSCTAFTAPPDPQTGIRQDVPASWDDTPNPLDTPAVATRTPIAEGRFGHSNKGITW